MVALTRDNQEQCSTDDLPADIAAEPTLLEAALALRERGRAVVPVKGKAPFSQGWQSGELSLELLTERLLLPGVTGIGVVGGAPSGNLVVLDFDGEGWETPFEQVMAALPELAATPIVRTGSGKAHAWVRCPDLPETFTNEKLEADGLDAVVELRANRSCSVVPPSAHPSGGTYAWRSNPDANPVEVPIKRLRDVVRLTGAPVPDGARNSTLTSLAGRLRRQGWAREALEADLLLVNRMRCRPPLAEDEVRTIAGSVSRYDPAGDELQGGSTQVERLLALAEGARLIHADKPDRRAFLVVERETMPLPSSQARRWLLLRYTEAHDGAAPQDAALRMALSVLEAKAHRGEPHEVGLRVQGDYDTVWLDLADSERRVVRVTAKGWEVTTKADALFSRPNTLMPLPVPVRGGSIEELWPLVNVPDERDRVLLGSFLLGTLNPQGPYPLLSLQGEQGSGKSHTARTVRSLVDPSSVDLRAVPRDERDLLIAAKHGWVAGFDNVSRLSEAMSDALCRLASGAGFSTRGLYTDSEEVVFGGGRPVLINGIANVAERDDLRDRAILLAIPLLPQASRREEDALRAEFEAARPRLLGALLDGVASALKHRERARKALRGRQTRMADFALWAFAAAEAMPWTGDQFLEGYEESRAQGLEDSLHTDPVASAVLGFEFQEGALPWTGTPTELLERLDGYAPSGQLLRRQLWPANARVLSERLARLAPALRHAGIVVERQRTGQKRVVCLRRAEGGE